MKLNFTLNGLKKTFSVEPGENAQEFLQRIGCRSVRDSDNHQGFCGSDTVILNGKTVNAGLLIAAQLEGKDVRTIESVNEGNGLSAVQSAMVDCGLVQSGYNSPAAALLLTTVFARSANPP